MSYTELQKKEAWKNAMPIDGYSPDLYRKDICGAWIAWDKYGVQDSALGWEIDHIFPESLGGDERGENLCAIQHQNNASKGDDYPTFNAVVTAQGNTNIRYEQVLTISKPTRQNLQKLYPNA